MLLTTFYRISKTSLISFWRNRWLSLAATFIMVLTLVTISIFISLLIITDKTTATLKEKVDMSVYFNESATQDQIVAVEDILKTRSDIKSVEYISKEEALVRWRERNDDNEKIRDIISESDNPLPRSLEVKTIDPKQLESIYQYLSGDDYKSIIREISYRKNKDLVDKLVRITTFIKIAGWSLSIVFVLIAVLIIYNTIRLTMFARSGEIDIMKLVGASDWYVRGPFIIEGIGYGLIGAILSSVILYFALEFSVPATEKYLGVSNLSTSYIGINMVFLCLVQFVVGIALGFTCSMLAIKRHLK